MLCSFWFNWFCRSFVNSFILFFSLALGLWRQMFALWSTALNKCFGNYFGVYLKLSFLANVLYKKKKNKLECMGEKKAIFLILLAVNSSTSTLSVNDPEPVTFTIESQTFCRGQNYYGVSLKEWIWLMSV